MSPIRWWSPTAAHRAANVQVVDALPYPIVGIAVNSTQVVCTNGIACQLGDLGVGGVVFITVTGLVRTDVLSGTSVEQCGKRQQQ